jgi:hypothetical protein
MSKAVVEEERIKELDLELRYAARVLVDRARQKSAADHAFQEAEVAFDRAVEACKEAMRGHSV